MLHQLKIDQKYFQMKARGEKRWEIREDDRHFLEGDFVALNETINGKETGRFMIELVTAIVSDAPGVREGFVILSTVPCVIATDVNCHETEVFGMRNREVEGKHDSNG